MMRIKTGLRHPSSRSASKREDVERVGGTGRGVQGIKMMYLFIAAVAYE